MARRGVGWLAAVGAAALVLIPAGGASPASGSAEPARLYVVHGVPGSTADILLDGASVAADAASSEVIGPIETTPGTHDIVFRPDGGTAVTAIMEVAAGEVLHVVAHRAADATAPPRITVFPDDVSPVGPGKARLAVAHTAVVPPADVRVDGAVLFENIANSEVLELEVPAQTYRVDIVPTGAESPVVFGPTDLKVAPGTLLRVFAVGDPSDGGMEAVVHAVPLDVFGAPVPAVAPMGDGGQVAARQASDGNLVVPAALGAVVLAVLVGLAVRLRPGEGRRWPGVR